MCCFSTFAKTRKAFFPNWPIKKGYYSQFCHGENLMGLFSRVSIEKKKLLFLLSTSSPFSILRGYNLLAPVQACSLAHCVAFCWAGGLASLFWHASFILLLVPTQGSLIFTPSFFTPLDFTQSGEETVSKVSLFNLSELLFFSRHYTI